MLPYYFRITSDTKENVTSGAELENPHRLLTGRFDLAFVLIYLYPLLILALSYNLLSAEKKQGTPSRVEMIQAVRDASDEANAEGSKLLARYYEDHPELAAGDAAQAMNDFNVIRVAVGADVERRVRPVLDRYERQLASQQQLVRWLRFLSPAILMQDALNDISGTGIPRHRHFMAQVGAYHSEWRDYFVPLIFRKAQRERFSELPTRTSRPAPWPPGSARQLRGWRCQPCCWAPWDGGGCGDIRSSGDGMQDAKCKSRPS